MSQYKFGAVAQVDWLEREGFFTTDTYQVDVDDLSPVILCVM